MENELFPAGSLIPHKGRMKLLEWIRRPIGKTLQAEATANPDWPLFREGMVSSEICIELVAQTIAALRGFERGDKAGRQIGLLVGVKEADFSAPGFPVGTRLSIRIAELYHLEGYAVYEGQIRAEPDFFCKTVLQVLEPGEEILFDLESRRRIQIGEKERKP
jgi:predicted hotdog family 3-hydroxylacyl-ACP dehydratase